MVLLELVIYPTCSIVLEHQPSECDIMKRKHRNPDGKLLTSKTLFKSIIQRVAIFTASFGTYFAFLSKDPNNVSLARAMGLTNILVANILLVQVNSLNSELAIKSVKKLI